MLITGPEGMHPAHKPGKIILPYTITNQAPVLTHDALTAIPQPIGDFVFVFADKEYEDIVTIQALDETDGQIKELDLEKDVSYHPLENRRIWGTIASVPLYRPPILGKRYVGGNRQEEYVKVLQPPVVVQPGDKVYMHYHSLDENNRLILADGRTVYLVEYGNLFCAVRWHQSTDRALPFRIDNRPDAVKNVKYNSANDTVEFDFMGEHYLRTRAAVFFRREFVMLNGRILVHPKMETWADCFIGGVIGGVQTKLHPEPIKQRGVVMAAGDPYPGESYRATVVAGDEIYFDRECEFENEIEGRPYYVMNMHDVNVKFLH